MNSTLELIKKLNGLKEQSEKILEESKSKVSELRNILENDKDKIAERNISDFKKLIEAANIENFGTSFTFGYYGSAGKENLHVVFSKKSKGFDGTIKTNFFSAHVYHTGGGWNGYGWVVIYDIDTDENTKFYVPNGKHFLFVEHYEQLKKDLINAIQKQIEENIEESEKKSRAADSISANIESLRA